MTATRQAYATCPLCEATCGLEIAVNGGIGRIRGDRDDVDRVRMEVAAAHPGANSNVLADELLVDPLSGNAILNGIPVELAPVAVPARSAQRV